MGISKETFVDLQEKYEKVKKLLEEDSKVDPETEPYLSKYAARQLLIGMKANLEKLIDQTPDNLKLIAMLGIVRFYLGLISVDTEELSTGETQLNEAIKLVEDHCTKPEFVLIMLNSLNQLGILWSNRNEVLKSKGYLERSLKLYEDFKALNVDPLSFNDLFQCSSEENQSIPFLEKTHTLTLYYLAQVYGVLKDALKSAIYCHVTLKRQLEFNDYEDIDWALNAATLSQFFMEKNGFKQARHHLAAASFMLSKYEAQLNQSVGAGEELEAKYENFKHRSADVARCWAKYGLLLLSSSRERLLHHTDDDDDDESSIPCSLSSDLAQLQLTPDSSVSSQDLSDLYFNSIDLEMYEQQVTDQFALTFDDARYIFLSIQTWLNDAQLYYTLDNHASDYVQIIQDLSQMFNYLAFFEDNPERQSKMHKRRVNHLENVIKELNPTYYLQVCRQIWYELGETYVTILEIKLDKLRESSERPSPHALSKINVLVEKSIQHFKSFIDSIKELASDETPTRISEDLEKPALKAYFHIAAMYGKFITPDRNIQIENNNKSLEYFTKLTSYCDKYPEAQQYVATELGVSKEMVQLLPLKIIKISQEISA